MSLSRIRAIHIWGVLWFFLCAGYVLFLSLVQAGLSWTAVYTLSGHSIVLLGFLCLVYVYAIYHGIGSRDVSEAEHPLTRSPYYLLLYVATPFLGTMAGLFGCLGLIESFSQLVMLCAFSSVVATIAFWIVIDPLLSICEPLVLPDCRRYRATRLADQRQQQQEQDHKRMKLLDHALYVDRCNREKWKALLSAEAQKLVHDMANGQADYEQRKNQARTIGLKAWKAGGLGCMKELRSMVSEMHARGSKEYADIDCLSYWWVGIGNWRVPPLNELFVSRQISERS